MISIIKGRGQGKTYSLIILSELLQVPIVVSTIVEIKNIKNMAKSLNKNIPEPILWNENNKELKQHKNILVDEIRKCDGITLQDNIIGYSANPDDFYKLKIKYDIQLNYIKQLKKEIEILKNKNKEIENYYDILY